MSVPHQVEIKFGFTSPAYKRRRVQKIKRAHHFRKYSSASFLNGRGKISQCLPKLMLTILRCVHRGRNTLALRYFVTSKTDTSTGAETIDEKKRKLLASFGVSADTMKGKPMGKPIQVPSQNCAEQDDIVAVADTIEKSTEECEVSLAEQAWLDSGYIEYMDNQRDKGWKT